MAPQKSFDLDRVLCSALKDAASSPAPELDAQLKAQLWQKEDELKTSCCEKKISLWWVPMVANFIVCGIPALIFSLPIMPLWAHLAALALGWLAIGGIVLTFIELKFCNLKEVTTITLPKHIKKEAL